MTVTFRFMEALRLCYELFTHCLHLSRLRPERLYVFVLLRNATKVSGPEGVWGGVWRVVSQSDGERTDESESDGDLTPQPPPSFLLLCLQLSR